MMRTYNVLTLEGEHVEEFHMYTLNDKTTSGTIMQKVKEISEENGLTFAEVTWMDITPNSFQQHT